MELKGDKGTPIPISQQFYTYATYALTKYLKKMKHKWQIDFLKFVGALNKLAKLKHPKFILCATRKKIKRRKHGTK